MPASGDLAAVVAREGDRDCVRDEPLVRTEEQARYPGAMVSDDRSNDGSVSSSGNKVGVSASSGDGSEVTFC